jgi:3-deoxy-manno-octulosonate cytidylyltransferase (CMP-KDO synthetase)
MRKVLGVIPARLASTRLPRKMLADIGGKPLIWHTWKQAKKAKLLDDVVVATDSAEIADALAPFNAEVLMTSGNPETGTDRVAEAASLYEKFIPDVVLNIQGDEPMMPPEAIDLTADLLIKNPDAVMSTVASPITDPAELETPSVVKAVINESGEALRFTRANPGITAYKHLGLYGYLKDFLLKYPHIPKTQLEAAERLEQLRALGNGYPILVGIGTFDRIEVNTPEELEMVRARLRQ